MPMNDIFATRTQPAYGSPGRRKCFMSQTPTRTGLFLGFLTALWAGNSSGNAASSVYIADVPDYQWHAGCFGTATGNLIGFWDRHGFPDFYRGPTNGGIAPLNSNGPNAGITALWASEKGVDGRPADSPGHIDDYYLDYESFAPDPYILLRRTEHKPDSIGDFIGLNQDKWVNLNGECDGNIDGYSFVFWDGNGAKRVDYSPKTETGLAMPDLQSGLRNWAVFSGYEAETFTQLSDFNPSIPPSTGFTFADLKAEIDSGYPVLLFMQSFTNYSRTLGNRPRVNPSIHGMLAYGYTVSDDGTPFVRYRTSWASGHFNFSAWDAKDWTPEGILNLPLRGVIGFHPKPKIISVAKTGQDLKLRWHAPRSFLHDESNKSSKQVQTYILEQAFSMQDPHFEPVGNPTSDLETTIPLNSDREAYFRIRIEIDSGSGVGSPQGASL